MTTEPALAYPDFNRDFALETNASVQDIGAVLSQHQEDEKLHPIAYVLSTAEQGYGITKFKILTVVTVPSG